MQRRNLLLRLGLLLILLGGAGLRVGAQGVMTPSGSLQVGSNTEEWLRHAPPNATATIMLGLHDQGVQGDLEEASAIRDRRERRRRVHQLLSKRAQENERALREFLHARGLEPLVLRISAFKTFNGLAVTSDTRTVEALKQWERTASINLTSSVQLVRPAASGAAQTQGRASAATEWGVGKIGAERVWSELGIRGAGVVVGIIDTGAHVTHEALRQNYRCAASLDHSACWKDAIGGRLAPYDDNGHGTHTTGTAVGALGIGVAPGASWIACKGLDSSGNGTDQQLIACMDWMLAPGGDPANAPDLVNSSWGNTSGSFTGFQQAINSWVSAGIYPIFSAGNTGTNGCWSVAAPASYSNVLAVGATDGSDLIAYFSSRGPSPLTNQTRPDVSAPGVNIRSAHHSGDSAYITMSGTSMAAPHVAGLAALLLEASPQLSLDQLSALIKGNAVRLSSSECGSSGSPNNLYGAGRIQAYESLSVALGSTPTPTSGSVDPEWQAGTSYSSGALVGYQGRRYRCRQPHIALAGWEPPNVPALWELQPADTPAPPTVAPATATRTRTGTGGTAPTATRTRTATSGGSAPTATRTATSAQPTSMPPVDNLLKNAGFELDANGDTKPDDWNKQPALVRSGIAKHSGDYSMRHSSNVEASYMSGQVVLGLEGGQRYSLSGWTFIPATTDVFTYSVQIVWRNQAGATLGVTTIKQYSAKTAGWVAFSGSKLAPSGTSSAIVRMSLANLSATVYADDFVLRRG